MNTHAVYSCLFLGGGYIYTMIRIRDLCGRRYRPRLLANPHIRGTEAKQERERERELSPVNHN